MIELGISSKKFWKLSWYEFGLLSLRIRHIRKVEFDNNELIIEMTRSFMSLYYNSVRSKKDKALTPQDFWKLSYDNKLIKEADPDLMDRMKRKFGSKLKPK